MKDALTRWERCSYALVMAIVMTVTLPVALRSSVCAAPATSQLLQRAQVGHLYVSDLGSEGGNGLVYRFPLDQNGLPATMPDASLRGGMLSPYGLAFDPDGYLYVSDVKARVVNVYAPGAEGDAKPVRVLSFPAGFYPQNVAVDRSGYLFLVDGGNSTTVLVYRPGAHGHVKPLHTMGTFGKGLISQILVDRSGALYVLEGDAIGLFEHPLTEWRVPTRLLVPEGATLYKGEAGWGDAMALDDTNQFMFVQTGAECNCGGWKSTVFGIRQVSGLKTSLDPQEDTRECFGRSSGSLIYGAAIGGDYLVFSCEDSRAVFVYDAQQGRQRLVESVGAGLWVTPAEVIFGP